MIEGISIGVIEQNWLEILCLMCFSLASLLSKRGIRYKSIWEMGVGDKGNSMVYPFSVYTWEHFVPDTILGVRSKEINKIQSLLLRGSCGFKYL